VSRDEYLDDHDDNDRLSPRSIFASGWFRALLVLGVLAVILVVTVPYLLRWMDSGPAEPARQASRPADPRPAPPPAPVVTPVPAPAPVASAVEPALQAPATPPVESTPLPKAKPQRAVTANAPVASPAKPAPAPRVGREAGPARAVPVRADAKPEAAAKPAIRAESVEASRTGEFWIQVGAFQDEQKAERLAASLRDDKMPVQITRLARSEAAPPSQHEVFVTGATVDVVNTALRGKGKAQAVRGGVAVQPALDLKEAVTLSKRLTDDGLSVKIQRASREAGGGEALHAVRVGGFSTRAQAQAARKELFRKGLAGFLVVGSTK